MVFPLRLALFMGIFFVNFVALDQCLFNMKNIYKDRIQTSNIYFELSFCIAGKEAYE